MWAPGTNASPTPEALISVGSAEPQVDEVDMDSHGILGAVKLKIPRQMILMQPYSYLLVAFSTHHHEENDPQLRTSGWLRKKKPSATSNVPLENKGFEAANGATPLLINLQPANAM